MKRIIAIVKEAIFGIINFIKEFIFLPQNRRKFVHTSYMQLLPLLSHTSSYIQSFLGIFASSIITIDFGLIIYLIGNSSIKSHIVFYFCVSLFISSLVLYLLSFAVIIYSRIHLLKKSYDEIIDIGRESFISEEKITIFYVLIFVSLLIFLVVFFCLVGNLSK